MKGSSAGAVSGSASSVSYDAKSGYVGQLYERTDLNISAQPLAVSEGTTRQLTAQFILDDGTTLAVSSSTVTWSIVSGPISGISASGLATAAIVYQDTSANVRGIAQSLTGNVTLTVRNVNVDDFGSYAGDGIDDAWQVQYFGQGNLLAVINDNGATRTVTDTGAGVGSRFYRVRAIKP